jgi:hypothetical protein
MSKQKKTKKQVKEDLQKIKGVAVAYETFSIDFDREVELDEGDKEWIMGELSSKMKDEDFFDDEDF